MGTTGIRVVAVVISAAAGLALFPAAGAAQDDCGEVVAAEAAAPAETEAPLAIGDSPMLVAVPNLAAAGFDVNAHGCRQYAEGLEVLRAEAADGTLPDFVVVALGTNGSITFADLDEVVTILGEGRVLGLATQPELDAAEETDADVIRTFAASHPENVVLLDWVAESEGNKEWFQPDGVHLTEQGAIAFTELLAAGIDEAAGLAGTSAEDATPTGETPDGDGLSDGGGGFPWGPLLIVTLIIGAALAILRRRAVVAQRIAIRRRDS